MQTMKQGLIATMMGLFTGSISAMSKTQQTQFGVARRRQVQVRGRYRATAKDVNRYTGMTQSIKDDDKPRGFAGAKLMRKAAKGTLGL